MHVTDWFPTLLSAAELTPSADDLDGIDQWEALMNASTASPRNEMVYNIKEGPNGVKGVKGSKYALEAMEKD